MTLTYRTRRRLHRLGLVCLTLGGSVLLAAPTIGLGLACVAVVLWLAL